MRAPPHNVKPASRTFARSSSVREAAAARYFQFVPLIPSFAGNVPVLQTIFADMASHRKPDPAPLADPCRIGALCHRGAIAVNQPVFCSLCCE